MNPATTNKAPGALNSVEVVVGLLQDDNLFWSRRLAFNLAYYFDIIITFFVAWRRDRLGR